MTGMGIQRRILLAVLLPSILIAGMLVFYLTMWRIEDTESAWRRLGVSTATNLASSAEYALVTGNRALLDTLVKSASQEPGVRFVLVSDVAGELLSWIGPVDPGLLHKQAQQSSVLPKSRWVISVPVKLQPLALDDPFIEAAHDTTGSKPDIVLGTVFVGMSIEHVQQQNKAMFMAGLVILAVGLVLAGGFAIVLSQTISRPVRGLSDMVRRLREGQLSARVVPDATGELHLLQEGINRMAESVEHSQAEMQQRTVEATTDLSMKKEEAERANKAKSRFLASVSHDLRQPMHAVGLFAATLRQKLSDPQHNALVERIQHSVSELEGMFTALLDLSELDAGVVQPRLRDFDVSLLLEHIWEEFAASAEEKGLRFRVRPRPVGVRSDPILLRRILGNLVMNAIRYTDRGGVLLACRKRGNQWLLQIWDSGIGIAQEDMPRIFEEYFQVGNPERNRSHGMGLGLATVAKLTHLLGHELVPRSRLGNGTVFSLALPAVQLDEQDQRTLDETAPGTRFSGESVLVIDDDREVLDSMAGLLESWGLNAVVAQDVDQALDLLDRLESAPRAVLCDFRLAGAEDGIRSVQRIRGRFGQHLPAALISGDTLPESVAGMKASGLVVLHKPVAPARLRALLMSLLSQA